MAHEFELVMQSDSLASVFEDSWEKYRAAIVSYSSASRSKSQDLKRALREDGKLYFLLWFVILLNSLPTLDYESLRAMCCLSYFLTTKSRKKVERYYVNTDIPYLVLEVPVKTILIFFIVLVATCIQLDIAS